MAEANTPVNPSLPGDGDTCNRLRVLLLGRTGQGKSTTGNKLLEAGGDVREGKIAEFEVGGGGESCTHEVRSAFRPETKTTKAIEVVDTPGFADSNTVQRLGVYKANLAMFRDLIRKHVNMKSKLRIHRVLYFLPCRGPLERADAVLQEEIRVMRHFFGRAIFRSMVLVGTFHQRMQDFRFNQQDCTDTRETFEKALTLAFSVGSCPKCPPVIFIGLKDAGVDIRHQIEGAAVTSNKGLMLDQFAHGTCFKCGANYLCQEGKPSDPDNRIGAEAHASKGKQQEEDEETYAPYQSSMCHPLFVPKHSFWARLAGEAAHAATLYIPMIIQMVRKRELPWPLFTSGDEVCANCQQSAWSDGCWRVGEEYKATLPTGKSVVIIVDHTNLFEDYYSKYLEVS